MLWSLSQNHFTEGVFFPPSQCGDHYLSVIYGACILLYLLYPRTFEDRLAIYYIVAGVFYLLIYLSIYIS